MAVELVVDQSGKDIARWNALEELRVLDTPAEPAFDNLVQLAAQLCEVPVAAVTLLADGRQWCKARIGIPDAEMPLTRSLCRHAIMQEGRSLLVIEDLLTDQVFRTHDALQIDGLRFYAGAPLVLHDGTCVGALCVADYVPRGPLGENEAFGLRTLADQVVAQLELRRTLADCHASKERERARSIDLEQLALHDTLTGLGNRSLFQRRIGEALENGRTGLLLLDLDEFKRINDRFGHKAGDDMLLHVAECLRKAVRRDDVVIRFGGDEFAIILPNVENALAVAAIADRIMLQLTRALSIDGSAVCPQATIGGAISSGEARSADDLLREADLALYAGKRAGRGRKVMFGPAIRKRRIIGDEMVERARAALAANRIIPFYQPKVDLKTYTVRGFEALLRMPRADGGIDYPASIEAAFKTPQLAQEIGRRMLNLVARDAAGWLRRGLVFDRVSINAGGTELMNPDYVDEVLSICRGAGLPAECLEIEVTEKALLDDEDEQVCRTLSSLRSEGVNIALDDFGTGYSSLSHLDRWPVDVIKIDRSFVDGIDNNRVRALIVDAVLGLARGLNIETVAEGVEQADQALHLCARGCDQAQGYLFGAATPVDVAGGLLSYMGQPLKNLRSAA